MKKLLATIVMATSLAAPLVAEETEEIGGRTRTFTNNGVEAVTRVNITDLADWFSCKC